MVVVFESEVPVKDGEVVVMFWNMGVDELQLPFRGMTILGLPL